MLYVECKLSRSLLSNSVCVWSSLSVCWSRECGACGLVCLPVCVCVCVFLSHYTLTRSLSPSQATLSLSLVLLVHPDFFSHSSCLPTLRFTWRLPLLMSLTWRLVLLSSLLTTCLPLLPFPPQCGLHETLLSSYRLYTALYILLSEE